MGARDNVVTVEGNLTRTPELRFTQAGKPLADFGIAHNEVYTDSQGERQESTSFFDVTVWGEMAENVAGCLEKGDRVRVTGRLKFRQWENGEGEKRSKVDITADDVAVSLRWATVAITKTHQSGPRQDAPPPQEDVYDS